MGSNRSRPSSPLLCSQWKAVASPPPSPSYGREGDGEAGRSQGHSGLGEGSHQGVQRREETARLTHEK
eukprot:12656366-Heterocapsa_arctica.AAC.1